MLAPTPHDSRRPVALIVDDEPALIELVRLGLTYEGFQVLTARDGEEAVRLVREQRPDLVILDIMLPRLDGFTVCERIRRHHDVPLIMLTARDEVADRVHGLNLGADDYLLKPFRFEELLARVRAVLRRKQPAFGAVLQVGNVRMDVEAREVERGGEPVVLTTREFDLLRLFLEHPRQVFGKETILNRVWGYDFGGDANVVEVYVCTLRDKLNDHPPQLIQTIRGAGYRMAAP
jgi:two-component system response regulator MprA